MIALLHVCCNGGVTLFHTVTLPGYMIRVDYLNLSTIIILAGESSSLDTPAINKYNPYLKRLYGDYIFQFDEWPPMVSDQYVNLALINHENMPNSWDVDDFMKSTLHGTVDDIHFEKQTIGLENLFKPKDFLSRESLKLRRQLVNESVNQQFGDLLVGLPGTSDRVEMTDQLLNKITLSVSLANSILYDSPPQAVTVRDEKGLRVLLDGAPGVGKTTFCHNACKDWADDKLFSDFKLMVYVPLRENQVANSVEIEHLFCYGPKVLRQAVARELEDTDGEDVLLVLDGWDELSSQQRGKQSLLCRIIQRRILPRCSILITSRPYASNWLRNPKVCNRHVEIFGFTEQQINQCIQNMLDSVAAESLLQKLQVRTDLKALCYVPMNLAMVLYIFKALDFNLPNSLTGVYDAFTNNALLRYLQEHDPTTEPLTVLKDRKVLPDDVKQLFIALCNLAYDGLFKDQMVFSVEELERYHTLLATSSNSLGLLTAFKGFSESGIDLKYQFLHLTIQEFLAAESLSHKPVDVITEFIVDHLGDIRFHTMLRFVFGKAHYNDIEVILSFLFATASSSKDESRFLFLCHMLYEAQHIQAIRDVGRNQPPCTTTLTLGTNIGLFDAMVIGRFLSFTSRPIKSIDMYDAHVSRQKLKLLTDNLSPDSAGVIVQELFLETRGCTPSEVTPFILHPVFQATSFLKIDIPNAPEIAAMYFSTMMMMPNLTQLEVRFRAPTVVDGTVIPNPKEDVVLAMQKLFEAITHNPKITNLEVWSIGDKRPDLLNESCSKALSNMIKARETQISLQFRLSIFSTKFFEIFSNYIATSTKLKEFRIQEINSSFRASNCTDNGRITSGEAEMLFTAMKSNNSLETFQLKDSKFLFGGSRCDSEATDCTQALEDMLYTNSCLKTLSIINCHIWYQDLTAISNGLMVNHTLTELHLESIETEPDPLLVALTSNMTVSSVILKKCHLEDRHEPSISTMLQNGIVTSLNLSNNDFGSCGAIGLFTSLQSSKVKLESLVLSGNRRLGTTHESVLAAMVEQALECNSTLKHLDLDHCSLHALVVESVATAMASNTVLESLSLRNVKITSPGVWQICTSLQVNTALKKVSLRDSIILDSTVIDQLSQVLNLNSTLETIYMNFDSCFSEEGTFRMFLDALGKNTSLKVLSITGLETSHVDKINFDRIRQKVSVITIK